MNISEDAQIKIVSVAQDSLSQFDQIARIAQQALRESPKADPGAFASINTLTQSAAIEQLRAINRENRASYYALTLEPAIARVVAVGSDGKERVYYICRATPVTGVANLASYRAPIGRLASLPIGGELKLGNGMSLELLEKAEFHPFAQGAEWDSRDTTFEADEFGPITYASLRAAIESLARPPADLLGEMLASEEQRVNVIQGRRRGIIMKMELRDQPVLDQLQDEIFRLPLNSRLLLLGPPGTGKTTTLIRRLGQKLDFAALDEREQHLVRETDPKTRSSHASSWLMFTPTDLLRQYLKESFAREGVPASDLHIRTWADYRRELARNTFGILRSGSGRGTFVLRENAGALTRKAMADMTGLASEFDEWQRARFLSQLRGSIEYLRASVDGEFRPMAERLMQAAADVVPGSIQGLFLKIEEQAESLGALIGSLKENCEQELQGTLNLLLNRNKAFVDELAEFLQALTTTSEADGESDEGEEADSDEESSSTERTPRLRAISAYTRAVRAYARACAGGRPVSKESRNGQIIAWLGDRVIERGRAAEIGRSLRIQSDARRVARSVTRYLSDMARRYRVFRRNSAAGWYRNDNTSTSDLDPLEADVLLLCILRGSRAIAAAAGTFVESRPFWSALLPSISLHKNQVYVDEVTDFSPIQIACMAALANPRTNSLFVCGDLHQRLTPWGARSVDEIRWGVPDFELREVRTCYRQSRQLYEFSRAIIEAAGGAVSAADLPPRVDSEGVAPVLLERATGQQITAEWLGARVREIEAAIDELPSIAVFVDGESEVQSLADRLGAVLAGDNVRVTACPNGQVIGQDVDVRVFDVQHVKGLEFEAVFFVGIDRLAASHPDLVDKYLYVGATRAATYLGVTCVSELPDVLSPLRTRFIRSWIDS